MICPACREEMIVVEHKQIELDVCVRCRGVWFDADELELLLDSLDLPADQLLQRPGEKSAEATRKCPYCRRKMEKVWVGSGDGVMIDKCKRGHGLWFDGGEVDTVIAGLRKTGAGEGASEKAGEEVGSFLADILPAGEDEPQKGEQE